VNLLLIIILFSGLLIQQDGISVNQLSDIIIIKYDQDGVVDVTNDSFLRTKSTSSRGTVIIKTTSRGLLFSDADATGDHDGKVTQRELMALLYQFDEDCDGSLTWYQNWYESLFGMDSEWEVFDAKYEEREKYEVQ